MTDSSKIVSNNLEFLKDHVNFEDAWKNKYREFVMFVFNNAGGNTKCYKKAKEILDSMPSVMKFGLED